MSIAVPTNELMKSWPRISIIARRKGQSPSFSTAGSGAIDKSRSFTTTQQLHTIPASPVNQSLENRFINALVQAGSCRKSRVIWPTKSRFASVTKRETWVQPAMSYNRLPFLVREDIELIGLPLSKKRLLILVDEYHDTHEDDHKSNPTTKPTPPADLETLESDMGKHNSRVALLKTLDDDTLQILDESTRAINSAHYDIFIAKKFTKAREINKTIKDLLRIYRTLPRERFLCLHPEQRQRLMNLILYTPKRSEVATARFLSVLSDMKTAGIRIPSSLYNHAIHLVGRTRGLVTHNDVEAALRQWTSAYANATTFNILFDIAVKGYQFALAEMILKEMEHRDLQKDRFTRVGQMYYHGLRGDGDAIRKMYRELVEYDLVVDTTVLNCVIASLLRAGEAEAAYHVFQRMKEFSLSNGTNPNKRDLTPKERTKALKRAVASLALNHPQAAQQPHEYSKLIRNLQQEQDISPDTKTFTIVVSHYVSETGDFERITYYLSEMQSLGIAPCGSIFMHLFRGFWNHGGKNFTLWEKQTLNRVWMAFRQLANEEANDDVYWDKWVVLWLLRAYTKCFDRRTAMHIWTFVQADWKEASEYDKFMIRVMREADHKLRRILEPDV